MALSFLLFAANLFAQEGVRTAADKKEFSGKILLVPYESKMYMGEVDEKINKQTKWTSSQINEYFRHQLDTQLKLKLQSVLSPVLTFYVDSIKTAKDLDYIYKSTAIRFDKVGTPTAPTAVDAKKEPGIKDGQVEVKMNEDQKFSNIKFTSNDLVPYLNTKYKSEYFVFVNELDIRTIPESYDLATDSYQREVMVHYTIVDKTSKLILAGVATAKLSSKENNPKKIVSNAFSPIATYIATRLSMVITPKK